MRNVTVIARALRVDDEVKKGDSIPNLVLASMKSQNLNIREGDILVISSKIVSKSEGRVVGGEDVQVSCEADSIAKRNAFDPVHVELALRDAVDILRSDTVLITEIQSGLVCNFSGVDRSNTQEGTYVLLPIDPDGSAEEIRLRIEESEGCSIAVILSDTQGRPWRKGSINVAIGCSGISPFKHNRGKRDLHGRILKRSTVCQVDEICALAENLMGQADQRIPAVLVRGYSYTNKSGRCVDINRSRAENLVR